MVFLLQEHKLSWPKKIITVKETIDQLKNEYFHEKLHSELTTT